jgi:hypothetical protein
MIAVMHTIAPYRPGLAFPPLLLDTCDPARTRPKTRLGFSLRHLPSSAASALIG